MWRLLLLLMLPSPIPTRKPQLVISRECIEKIELTDGTYAIGPDLHLLSVKGLILTYKAGCEKWVVQ